jgi:hypothetical protein
MSTLPIPSDDCFAVKISESMDLRNILRAALVEAQGHDTDRIPILVSWPEWLEDGIVCLYARDLHQLLRNTVRETATVLGKVVESEVENTPESNNRVTRSGI